MRGQRHAQAALYPRKDPVPIVQKTGCAPGPVWTGAENLAPPPTGFDPRIVQPVANRYTDYVTRPTLYGKVVQFRSFRTKHALMCKIHEQDKVSALQYVLCSLVNMSDFFFLLECLIL